MKRGFGVVSNNAVDVVLERKRIRETMVIPDDVQQFKGEYEYCKRIITKALESIQTGVEAIISPGVHPVQPHPSLGTEIAELLFWTQEIDNAVERIMCSSAMQYISEVAVYSNFYCVALHWPDAALQSGYSKRLLGAQNLVTRFKADTITKEICKVTWSVCDGSSYQLVMSLERWQTFWNRFIKFQQSEQHKQTQHILLVHLPSTLSVTVTGYVNYSILDVLGFLHVYLKLCSHEHNDVYEDHVQQQRLLDAVIEHV